LKIKLDFSKPDLTEVWAHFLRLWCNNG